MIASVGFHFAQPWWLLAGGVVVPLVWLSWRNLEPLGRARRILAVICRIVVVAALAAILARPTITRTNERLTLIAVVDRSRSVPDELAKAARAFLGEATSGRVPGDHLAVVDVAEAASISKLPSTDMRVLERNTGLTGGQSDLAGGVQMAMAIAPPDTAVRILLVSDGNETEGDLAEAARIAAANGIPVDVLPLQYTYEREVIFRRLAAPASARSGQTIRLRLVLNSTHEARGRLMLSLNGRPVKLDPTSDAVTVPVALKPGTNVKTVSIPVGSRGMHEFEAVFLPDEPGQDQLVENNRASAMTFVAGPGHVLVVDGDGAAAAPIVKALRAAKVDVRYTSAAELPDQLPKLLDADAVVMANTSNSLLTLAQQEMLVRYVRDLGGGLVMVGGPESFGAGGWIGSPVAEILPVDPDPPQKKEMPRGALVLIMHACEMPKGNYWGKRVAIAAVRSLSRLDYVGVLDYGWSAGNANWVHPFAQAGDKSAAVAAIKKMEMGDMPDFQSHMRAAYEKLSEVRAGQKHIIIISDGDPSPPRAALLTAMRKAGITCTTVAVFPHGDDPALLKTLITIAKATGGRFYNVKDPNTLPQIFIKEAQVVRRALIIEETFSPRVTYSLSELLRGLRGLPKLDGYVLTGPRGGKSQIVLTSEKGDPILASAQMGLGRTVAFTSSADSRWAGAWLRWGGANRFWEQTTRWVSKASQPGDLEIFADVQGRTVTLSVEALEAGGTFLQLAQLGGQVIAPDMSSQPLALRQVGPGRYRATFRAGQAGSHLVNLRYRKPGAEGAPATAQTAVIVPYAPEFRDLSDNAALLAHVAATTGGRVIGGPPERAELFSRDGVRMPKTLTPLTVPLMLVWLGAFLLDVAVRRVAVDFRAVARRAAAFAARRKTAREADRTLAKLKARRKKLREQWGADAVAARRFEAGQDRTQALPETDVTTPAPAHRPPASPAAAEPKAPAEEPSTHLDRLLRAKRKASGRENRNDNTESGDP